VTADGRRLHHEPPVLVEAGGGFVEALLDDELLDEEPLDPDEPLPV
jgi:hypothetical protein